MRALLEEALPVGRRDPSRAYCRVAAEYDDDEHATTRILEELSRRGLAQAVHERSSSVGPDQILEYGAGTGALTVALLSIWSEGRIHATDPSPEMLKVLRRKLGLGQNRLSVEAGSVSTLAGMPQPAPDFIAAGLADPYLDGLGIAGLRRVASCETEVFVSVPSRGWAQRERGQRLHLPIDTTRFQLRDGSSVLAPSYVYDEVELCELLVEGGFVPRAMGRESSDALWSCPEVCWALAEATCP